MTGYTPLFASITTGTLCGKWPDIGLWPIILSMSDRHGEVDVTCEYISTVTGLALADVRACMARFCAPDDSSRSGEESGARLVLIDAGRDWGWRIVNFHHYRERARLAARNAADVESGRNRERMRDRRGPPPTPADRPSDKTRQDSKSPTDSVEQPKAARPVEAVFEHWKQSHGHPKAVLDAKRRRLIVTALKEYEQADLIKSISGYLHSEFHMGKNDRHKKYDDITLFLRDAKNIERGIEEFEKHAKVADSGGWRDLSATEGAPQ